MGKLQLVSGDSPFDCVNAPVISLDTETTGLLYTDNMLGMSLAWRDQNKEMRSCYIRNDYGQNEQLGLFEPAAEMSEVPGAFIQEVFGKKLVFHNLPFDYRVLYKTLGTMPTGPNYHDTMHIARSVARHESLSLEFLYEKYVGPMDLEWKAMKKKRDNLAKVSLFETAKYGRRDAEGTLLLYEKLRTKAYNQLDPEIYKRDLRFTELVMRMVARGVGVDQDWMQQKRDEFQSKMLDILHQTKKFGVPNPGSDDQVRKLLFKRLGISSSNFPLTDKSKVPSVAEEVLVGMGLYGVPEVRMIIDYRQLVKGISSWLDPIGEYSRADGRIHSRLAPFGTASFRMSASDINMQGVPMKVKNKEQPKAFGCFSGLFFSQNPDEELWSADIKQAEVRLASMLAGSNGMAEVLSIGTDPYVEMSIRTWNTPKRRDDAKRATLASIYEIGPESFSIKYGIPRREAEKILNEFRKTYPEMAAETRRLESIAMETKNVESVSGRKIWFFDNDDFYKAFNQRVQGTVAEVMDIIMLNLADFLGDRLVLQVHDNLVMELSKEEKQRKEIIDVVAKTVNDSIPQYLKDNTKPSIPFLIDAEKW